MDLTLLIICALCCIVILKIISILQKDYVLSQKLKNIPADRSYPFVGIAFKLISMTDEERTKWYLSLILKFKEGIFLQWIGREPMINLYKPEYFEAIFPSNVNINKGKGYDFIQSWLGEGLLTSSGSKWFHDRRLIGPTFHFNILDQFAVIQSEKAELLIKCLEKELQKKSGAIDIFPFILNAALDIICETAMGVNVHAQETVTKYTSSVSLASTLVLQRLFQPWYGLDWIYYSTPNGKKYKSTLDILHGFTKKVINEKKTTRQLEKAEFEDEENENMTGKRKRKAFLDLLLDENKKDNAPLTDDELRAQVDTFMFEGHDTTAVGITWALFCLGNNLEHQEKVHQELEDVFKDSQEPPTLKQLSQLKYLERVIKEALRIFPSVPLISRKLTESIKIGDYVIPEGVNVTLSILLMHRNPKVWPDPLKFDPDRFLPENSRNRNPYAHVPFSAGPRNCIGQRFALLEEKIVLTAILRKWRLKSVKTIEEIRFASTLILRPCEEILLHLTPKI